jgi:RNA polymerase subunit RPABC4/transcription elongation factor Spt4
VAAFCECCGAEITLKAEACPVCGTPQHGMSQPDFLLILDVDADPSQEDARIGPKPSKSLARKLQ